VSKLILEGGTDVAEVALFSVDDLPQMSDSTAGVVELEERDKLVRLPTGSDGAYLLHVHVDEPIPADIKKYCVDSEVLTSDFETMSGNIAFGGAESAFSDYKPNPNIRSDTRVPPGRYRAIAYHTDYPDNLIEDAIESEIGTHGVKKLEFAGTIIMIIVGLVLIAPTLMIVLFRSPAVAFGSALASVLGGMLWHRTYTRADDYKALTRRSREIQKEYPSIVIRLVKAEDL
jgi:hypothetical protein